MKETLIDIETYCEADIKKCGLYRYVSDPSFEILLIAWATDEGEGFGETKLADLASGNPFPQELLDDFKDSNVTLIAHNAAFERVSFSRYLQQHYPGQYLKPGTFLSPDNWICTMVMAASLTLPMALKDVGEVLRTTQQKDEEGKRLIKLLLKAYKRKTKQGSYEWSASTLAEIVANERHCGDIRAWKTFTPNFLTHKAKKNNGERTQFRRKNHHEAIVSRTVYEAANFLRASRTYAKKARPLPVLSVVDNGILRGYVPLDKDWTGFSTDEYQKASESVMSELEDTRQIEYKAGLDMRGYEVVRSQYFSTTQNPAMTIADGKLCFNTACLKKFENVEYVELLLNSVNRCIAVRPCDGNNPNAIHWGKLREGRWCALSKSCRGLAKTLFDIMDWDQDLKYRFRGDFIENDDQKVMLFQLDEPEMVKTENIVLPPKEAETDDRAEIAGRTVKQIINILPPEWEDTFGRPITSIGEINLLEQRHYAADWDVLRPAKELAEYSTLTSEDLEELLHEAEKIIEGWPIPDEHGAGESADNGDGESAGVGTECGADVGAGTEENGDRADL